MSKLKTSITKTGKYLREISVVVIGVAITLSVNYWISSSSEKRNLALYLNALKIELEENAEMLDYYAEWLQKSINYTHYINTYDVKSLNRDTLNYYAYTDDDGCGYYYFHSPQIFKTNVFEMIKSSGAMRHVDDKELLASIWWAYTKLGDTKHFLDMCFQTKKEEAMKELQLKIEGKSIDVPMHLFYNQGYVYDMAQRCKKTSDEFKKTISKLEEAKIIKQ